ncbi:hypothetical protein [Streptomyces puniciscabiei]
MRRMKELGAQGIAVAGNSAQGDILSGVGLHPLPAGMFWMMAGQKTGRA